MKSLIEIYESIIDKDDDVLDNNVIGTASTIIAKAVVEKLKIGPSETEGEDPTKVNYITPLYISIEGESDIDKIDNIEAVITKNNKEFKKELSRVGIVASIVRKRNKSKSFATTYWSYSFNFKNTYLGSFDVDIWWNTTQHTHMHAKLECFSTNSLPIQYIDLFNKIYEFAGVKH